MALVVITWCLSEQFMPSYNVVSLDFLLVLLAALFLGPHFLAFLIWLGKIFTYDF